MMPPRYVEWLLHVFDHAVTDPHWYFELNAPQFEASALETTLLVTCTMENCGRDLAIYSDDQVDQGLNYLFSNACSDNVFSVMSEDVPIDIRVNAIRSIKRLYADCFEVRCAPVLSHLNELSSSKLNGICYMLWDITPLNYWEARTDKHLAYNAVVDVMEAALGSQNIACLEGALHGLGHTQRYLPERITSIVERFLASSQNLRPELKAYAENAATGYML